MFPTVLRELARSEKAVFTLALIAAATVLTSLEHMSMEQWIDYTKYLATLYIPAKAIQGVAQVWKGSGVGTGATLGAALEANDAAADAKAEELP